MTHICVNELTIIGSDNGLSPGRRQAIIWNNAGLLLIEPLGTNFSEISIEIQTFSFKKMHLNMSSAKWRPFCLGLNELIDCLGSILALLRQVTHNQVGINVYKQVWLPVNPAVDTMYMDLGPLLYWYSLSINGMEK